MLSVKKRLRMNLLTVGNKKNISQMRISKMLEAQCRKGDDIHNFVIWAKSAVLVEKEIEGTMGLLERI